MLRLDITVADLGELSTVHVAQLAEGANAWVDSLSIYWILEKNSGAIPDGINVIAPLGGSPIAGNANARWIKQIVGGTASPSAAQVIRFPINTSPLQMSATPIPANSIILSASLDIKTPYTTAAGSIGIQVGQTGTPAAFQDVGDNTPGVADLYGAEQDTVAASTNPVLVTVLGTGLLSGAGFCIVVYVTNPNP